MAAPGTAAIGEDALELRRIKQVTAVLGRPLGFWKSVEGLELVMPPVDVDVEMLESFLDGQLSDAQADAVRQKLAVDSVFGKVLEELVAERATRDEFYASLQRHDSIEDQAVDRLLAGVEKSLDDDERRRLAASDRLRMLRYIAAAAACVLFSFSAGWIGHRHASDLPILGGNLASNQAGMVSNNSGIGTLLTSLSRSGSASSGSELSGSTSGRFSDRVPGARSGVDVALTDPLGRVAVQHFDAPEEAREFIQDVGRWQQEQLSHHAESAERAPLETHWVKEQF